MILEINIDSLTIDWKDLRLFFYFKSHQDDGEGIGFDLSFLNVGDTENFIGLERDGSHLFFTLLGRSYTLIKSKRHRG